MWSEEISCVHSAARGNIQERRTIEEPMLWTASVTRHGFFKLLDCVSDSTRLFVGVFPFDMYSFS